MSGDGAARRLDLYPARWRRHSGDWTFPSLSTLAVPGSYISVRQRAARGPLCRNDTYTYQSSHGTVRKKVSPHGPTQMSIAPATPSRRQRAPPKDSPSPWLPTRSVRFSDSTPDMFLKRIADSQSEACKLASRLMAHEKHIRTILATSNVRQWCEIATYTSIE